MKHLARRKVVFVIVEGASDETALGIALNQVFDRESVHVHIMHCLYDKLVKDIYKVLL